MHALLVVVLGADDNDRPPHLEALNERMELRVTGRDGLADALAGAPGAAAVGLLLRRGPRRLATLRRRWSGSTSLPPASTRCSSPSWSRRDVVVTNARGIFDRPIAEFVLASVLAHAKLLHESHDLQAHASGGTARPAASPARPRSWSAPAPSAERSPDCCARPGWTYAAPAARRRTTTPTSAWSSSSADLAARRLGRLRRQRGAADRGHDRDSSMRRSSAAMRPTAHFVNVGRGASVVEDDLLDALHSGGSTAPPSTSSGASRCRRTRRCGAPPGLVVSAHMSGDVVGWRDALAPAVRGQRRALAGRRAAAERGGQGARIRAGRRRDGPVDD